MKTYHIRYLREERTTVESASIENAAAFAKKVASEFPDDTCWVLSIHEDGYDLSPTVVVTAKDTPTVADTRAQGLATKVRSPIDPDPKGAA